MPMYLGRLCFSSLSANKSHLRKGLFCISPNGFVKNQRKCTNLALVRKTNLNVQNIVLVKHSFHTTNTNNALPPIIWVVLRSALKFVAVFTGRGLRKWWTNLPKGKKRTILEEIIKQKQKIYIGGALSTGIVFVYYIIHLVEDPITKRKRFLLFSENQIQQMSMIECEFIMEQYKRQIVTSGYQYSYVLGIAQRIIQANKDLPGTNRAWKVLIVDDSETKNAFVLPSGQIFIFTGMLKAVSNDDQLAAIIGHEMAHALLCHSAEGASKTHLLEMLMLLPILAIWTLFPASVAVSSHYFTEYISAVLFKLPFSRSLETEADTVGLQMISRACFDPRQASVFWRKMEKLGEDESVEWLSTHPSHKTRYTTLDALMPEAIHTLMKFCKRDLDPRLSR